MKAKIQEIVEQSETKASRLFDFTIQALIILSLITFSISTMPDLSQRTLEILNLIEIITVAIFTAEYILRIYVADRKKDYIFSLFGIIDFLAILPFYLGFAVDLRSVRVLRLFRLFRILKIIRYNQALKRYKHAILDIREELVIFFLATLFMIYVSAVGIYYFEHEVQPEEFKSVFHSLWWAVATLTTVGYGDIYPVTAGGRIFTFFILMVGLSIVAIPAGLLASSLQETAKTAVRKPGKSNLPEEP